ncbi:hypothetical protein [Rhodopirellula sp. MGV]|uniref:hypothetical protein n=1 Tax=Rhodopirellula sp. MGV TaxID=2023130 RepID=UPI000B96F660|nr:hypothetical protein [Rhodopirellula sp. MGV]OYP33140.1 hypothetical protein CGZ80_18115 [Rhodopirellula sp. MGV]PNY35131.1 hypothetical protein C2E31_19705 [Rhodopirellula baltica]
MDSDKLKDFALYNFEKLIVLLIIAAAGFLAWIGYSKEDIRATRDPQRLATSANEVKNEVDNNHNEEVLAERRTSFEEFDIAKEQQKFLTAIPASLYTPQLWEPGKVAANKVRRKDPELSKPEGIQVQGVIASMAYRSKDGLYALADLEAADEVEKVEQKPTRSSRRNSRQNNMADMYGMMGGGMEGYESDMMMSGMGASSSGMAASTSGPVRKLPADENLGTKAAPTKSVANGEDQPPVPGLGYFIAGSAAIPHKKLIDSYQEALSYAAEYNPRTRDLPTYIAYQVERADVTNKTVDQLTDDDWILRDSNEITIRNAAFYWSGFAPEIVPRDYWVTGVTMWIPPILLDPYQRLATHPLIPLKTQRELDQEQLLTESELEAQKLGNVDMSNFQVDLKGGQTRAGGGGYGSGYGSGMEGDMGMGGYGSGMDSDMGGYGSGYGGSGYGGSGGSARGMEGKAAEENPVDYKLLRFYDFAYLRGAQRDKNAPLRDHKYVYRIRFAVNDPNFPEKPELQPKGKSLDPDAYSRVVSLVAKAAQTQERDYKRWSEWSDISEPVSLPKKLDQSFVGPAKPNSRAKYMEIGNRVVVAEGDVPTAEVVASSFDLGLGTFVPTTIEASEGTVLSATVESADVVDPITLEIKKTGEMVIESAATIIDLEGGVQMPIVKDDEEMTTPGMILMVDSDGKLVVRDSVEEQRIYRIKSYAKERGL